MSRYLILCLLLSTALAWADPCLSPDGRNALFFRLDQQGRPSYSVERDGQVVLKNSPLGFVFKDQTLLDGFTLERSTSRLVDEQWQPLVDEPLARARGLDPKSTVGLP